MAQSLAETLASELYYVELKRGKSLRRSFNDKAGRTLLASATSSDESSLTISRKLFPKGFDHLLKDAEQAVTNLKEHYTRHTIAADFHGSPQNGKAKSRRFIRASTVTGGQFFTENLRLLQDVELAGQRFASGLSSLIQQIEASGVLGSAFSADNYPCPDDIIQAYTFVPIEETLEPVPSGASIPITSASLKNAQEAYESNLATRYRFGMQRAAAELAQSLGTVAKNLKAHVEWESTPEHMREETLGRTKAPRLSTTLFPNVETAAARLKEFIIPETEDASIIHTLVDEIEQAIQPDRQSPDSVRSSVTNAERIADTADRLSSALEELDFF